MRSRSFSLLASLLAWSAAFSSGCGSTSDDGSSIDAASADYTGTSGTEVVEAGGSNLPANLRPLLGAFAKVKHLVSFESAPGACTGTHIGQGLVLTAGHCFRRDWQTGMVHRRTPRENDGSLERISVTFEDGKSYSATLLDWALTMQHDYAILKLEDGAQPSAAIPLRLAATAPAYGTKLTMLSYPDERRFDRREGMVDETKLIWSRFCTYDDSSGEEDRYGMVDVAHGRFAHQCESEPGSSGAALIDATTLEVVGIHNGELTAALFATKLDEVPVRQYVGHLPEPAAKLSVVRDRGVFADESADATVDAPAGTIESVAFELIDEDPAFTTEPPAQVKITSAPFTAHFDTTALTSTKGLRAIVQGKNGASIVLEDGIVIDHR